MTHQVGDKVAYVYLLAALVRRRHAVEGVVAVRGRAGVVEVRPELDEEEGLGRALLVQLLQPALLLGELVLDLAHVDRLQRELKNPVKYQTNEYYVF